MNNGLMIATQSANLNLNIDSKTLDMCLKTVPNFTSNTYMNICTGQQVTVPTGSFEWFIFFAFIVPLSLLLVFVVIFFIKIAFE